MLIAGAEGVLLVEEDGTSRLLVEGRAEIAIDDLDGGILFQRQRGTRDRTSTAYRVVAGGDRAVATLVADPDQSLTLNGVVRDGAPFIYYTRSEGSNPEDTRDTLRRFDMTTGEVTELSVIGYWESGSFPVSVGDGLVLMNWHNEATHGMLFTDLLGDLVDVAANPSPPEGFFDCGPCPRTGAVAVDGTRFVYRAFDDGVDYAVIVDVDGGEEIHRIRLDAVNVWTVTSFDLSPSHLIVNRAFNDDLLTPLLFDLAQAQPEPHELPVAGEAHLTRSTVEVVGPVPAA